MTFAKILKAIYTTYHIDFCYVADQMGIPDEVVQSWEEGKSFPSEEQLKRFSAMFAVPLSTLKESIKQN